MQLQLNLQPHNRYDKNAIGIFSGDAKQGYINHNNISSLENGLYTLRIEDGKNVITVKLVKE